jgi:uncharacterized membrane protein YphA (DoxX/SURF4 family)
MPVNTTEVLWWLGRLLLGAYFAWAGIHHFTSLAPIAASMTARGVPAARAVSTWKTNLALIGGLLIAAAYSLR